MSSRLTVKAWLQLMAKILGQPEPTDAMVTLYFDSLEQLAEKDLRAVLKTITASHQYGTRFPLPAEVLAAATDTKRDLEVRKTIHHEAPSPTNVKLFGLLQKWCHSKSDKILVEMKSLIDSMPDCRYHCRECKDSGLIQVWGILEKQSTEYHITRGKESIQRWIAERQANSPTWRFPYPDLVPSPDPEATMMVAACICKAAKYDFHRPEVNS